MDNIAIGSEGAGFVIPHGQCMTYLLIRSNTASSCQVGVAFNENLPKECQHAGYITVFHNVRGMMMNPTGHGHGFMEVSHIIAAENTGSIVLRYGSTYDHNSLMFDTSYIAGIQRTDCEYCWKQKSDCTGFNGVQLLVVTE